MTYNTSVLQFLAGSSKPNPLSKPLLNALSVAEDNAPNTSLVFCFIASSSTAACFFDSSASSI